MAGSSARGEAFSSSTVLAPTDSGNISSPPSPKVKASGGLPMNTSSARPQHVRRPAAQAAITSRWKCIVPLGTPVVPEVKAISAGVVGRGVDVVEARGLRGGASIEPSRPSPLKCSTCVQRRAPLRAPASEFLGQPRVAQRVADLRLVDDGRAARLARSSGMVPTAMPPALTTANQHAASIGAVGAAQQHAVAGHQAQVVDQHAGDAVGLRLQFGIGPVQALGQLQFGPLEQELRQRRGGGRWSRAKVSTCALWAMGRSRCQRKEARPGILWRYSLVVN
jgi:hypothetical protein